ncbi:MAG: hypothetical protein ACE5KE_11815, partial [Methanosarcinales archaeon]
MEKEFIDINGDNIDEVFEIHETKEMGFKTIVNVKDLKGYDIAQFNFIGNNISIEKFNTNELENNGIFIIEKIDTRIFLHRYEYGTLNFIKRYLLIEGKPRKIPSGEIKWDGGTEIIGVVHLNKYNKKALIYTFLAGFARLPRGLAALDIDTGEKIWDFRMGSFPKNLFIHESNGVKRFILTTSAPANEVEINDLDDLHSYILILNEDGKLIKKVAIGGKFSDVYSAYLKLREGKSILITLLSSSSSRKPEKIMYIWNPDSLRIIKKKVLDENTISKFLLADMNGDGLHEILIGDREKGLRVLDLNLNEIKRSKPFNLHEFLFVEDL